MNGWDSYVDRTLFRASFVFIGNNKMYMQDSYNIYHYNKAEKI